MRKSMDRIQRRLCLRSPTILPVILTTVWALLLASPESARGDELSGSSGAVQTLPYAPVHAHMLPTGKVLFYEKDNALIWDPDTGSLTTTPKAGYNLFCNGHAFIEDGKLFLAGGHITFAEGVANASYYDPFSNRWTNLPAMNAGRWYPTNVTLADGNVAVMSGAIVPGTNNNTPQVWEVESGSWRTLSGAERSNPLYPAAFLAPNGRVFVATATSRYPPK
jgi:galactose oxidase